MKLSICPLSGLMNRSKTKPRFVSVFDHLFSYSKGTILKFQKDNFRYFQYFQKEYGVFAVNERSGECFACDHEGNRLNLSEETEVRSIDTDDSYSQGGIRVSRVSCFPKPDEYTIYQSEKEPIDYLTDNSFLTIINETLIFYSSSDASLIKLSTSLQEVSRLTYTADIFRCQVFENIAIIYFRNNTGNFIELIDLVGFTSILKDVTDEKVTSIGSPVEVGDYFAFQCGTRFYIWTGFALQLFKPEKTITEYIAKDGFFYICFANDLTIYAYSADLQRLLKQRMVLGRFLQPFAIMSNGCDNFFRALKVESVAFRGICYLGAWTDEEFFSDDEIPVVYEEKIFIEKPILNEAGFSLDIVVSATEDYGTVFRQALAALDEAILVHAFDKAKVSYSKEFDGCIRLLIEKSSWMSKAERSQLTDACEELMRFVFMTGAATGNDCTCAVEFTDS